ncbi:ribonuclease H-like domain-containing protein [Tanacetum coccineum]
MRLREPPEFPLRPPLQEEPLLMGSNAFLDLCIHKKLHDILHLEAEYRGVANAVVETCWLRNLLRELHSLLSSARLVYCDNVNLVAAGQVRVLYVSSRYQFADIFTKGLLSTLFKEFRSSSSPSIDLSMYVYIIGSVNGMDDIDFTLLKIRSNGKIVKDETL